VKEEGKRTSRKGARQNFWHRKRWGHDKKGDHTIETKWSRNGEMCVPHQAWKGGEKTNNHRLEKRKKTKQKEGIRDFKN